MGNKLRISNREFRMGGKRSIINSQSAIRNSPLVWRLLDANANRARGGLRIIEDTARVVLDKPAAAKARRGLRPGLDELLRAHYKPLHLARDLARDGGRLNPASACQ